MLPFVKHTGDVHRGGIEVMHGVAIDLLESSPNPANLYSGRIYGPFPSPLHLNDICSITFDDGWHLDIMVAGDNNGVTSFNAFGGRY